MVKILENRIWKLCSKRRQEKASRFANTFHQTLYYSLGLMACNCESRTNVNVLPELRKQP